MSMKNILVHSIIFTFLIPGTVIVFIPIILTCIWNFQIEIKTFRYIGLILITFGAYFYISCVLSFARNGNGTPMIFFAQKAKKIFGEEPKKLVISGLYRFSRNPMYIGVFLFVLGIGIISEFLIIILWSMMALFLFHLSVIRLEEPHLLQKYGSEYQDYLNSTHRWLGFNKMKK